MKSCISPIILFMMLTLFFSGFSGRTQILTQTIKGIVTDRESQEVLPGAAVILIGSEPLIGCVTDIDGYFRLDKIPLGRYTLKASYLGYDPLLLREIVVGSGKEVVLKFEMKQSVTQMQVVEVTAKSNKDQAINTMAILGAQQISMEEANRYAGGFDDPSRLAASFAGVAGSMSNNGIVIRGNSPKGMLWKMEGVEISNPSHFADVTTFGGGGITALSSFMLANSDFYSGAFPAEYGNALSGVFDLKLRSGNKDKREYSVKIGTIGTDISGEGPIVKGKGSTFLFNYRYSTLALLTSVLPENAGGVRYQDFSFKTTFPINKTLNLSLWGIAANDISGAKAKTDSLEWQYKSDKEQVKSLQYNGAFGLSATKNLSNTTWMQTSLATSGNGLDWTNKQLKDNLEFQQTESVQNKYWNTNLSSFIKHKFNAQHSNKTGFVCQYLSYNYQIAHLPEGDSVMKKIADQAGSSVLFHAYSESKYNFGEFAELSGGISYLHFALNHRNSIEPRVALKINFKGSQSINIGYGHHTQREMLNIYFAQQQVGSNVMTLNKSLDFTKADHFILNYQRMLSGYLHLKAEVYYQYLYDVPVIDGTSFSMLNLDQNWYLNDALVNRGKGYNYGIDITLERFMASGYYYLFTASLFEAKYRGGDNILRDSRYNKHFVFNLLGGKEWKKGNNVLGVNGKINIMGGDRLTMVDEAASKIASDVIFVEANPFTNAKPNVFFVDLSVNYKRNHSNYAGTWSLQLINLLQTKEFNGYRFNYKTKEVETFSEVTFIPNLSWKIDF